MALQRPSVVKFALCLYIGKVRSMRVIKDANAVALPADGNLSKPLPSLNVPRNTEKARLVVPVARAPVLRVRQARYVSQVAEAVVCPDAVDVIDIASGPFAVSVQPRESVRSVVRAVNADASVSGGMDASSLFASNASGLLHKPCKDASFWIVVQQFAQTLRGKIGLSHEAVLSLIGKRPAGAINTALASLFYA